ncbi:MAG: helix-turn-helix transcriptional regulator [Eubacteriales bacterium]|nr:helix-turn-helix transcriptional regulator [Eubacteriales bacterium]
MNRYLLKDGQSNICGHKIKRLRESLPNKISQRKFAEMLQMEGLQADRNVVNRIEMGKRAVTDIELRTIVKVLGVTYEDLLED